MPTLTYIQLHIISFVVILTWLYNNTRGSLLMVTICHALSNTAGVFMPMVNTALSENPGSSIFYVLLEMAAAFAVIFIAGPAHLSRKEENQNYP